jgi:hypothetical protein
VLGWHPQGWLLIGDGPRLREVRIDLRRHSAQPPRDVRSPPAALLTGTPFSIDATQWATGDVNGIWVRQAALTGARDAPARFLLLRPAGAPAPFGAYHDFAWSPSGRLLAAAHAGGLVVIGVNLAVTPSAPPQPGGE